MPLDLSSDRHRRQQQRSVSDSSSWCSFSLHLIQLSSHGVDAVAVCTCTATLYGGEPVLALCQSQLCDPRFERFRFDRGALNAHDGGFASGRHLFRHGHCCSGLPCEDLRRLRRKGTP